MQLASREVARYVEVNVDVPSADAGLLILWPDFKPATGLTVVATNACSKFAGSLVPHDAMHANFIGAVGKSTVLLSANALVRRKCGTPFVSSMATGREASATE